MTPEEQQAFAALCARLEKVEADRAVRNVLARYMKLCDQPCHDTGFPQLGDLFTEDAIWEGVGALYSQTFGRQEGRADIVAFLHKYLAPYSTHFKMNAHFLTADAVTVDGDRARGEWVMLQASIYEDDTSELVSARLTVDFRKVGGAWLMSHFRTQRLFNAPWNGALPIARQGEFMSDLTVPGTHDALLSRFHLGGSTGPTVAIKDSIDIQGMPTHAGSRALANAPAASAHADVVRHLLDAGWQITAKAAMHELAFGMTGINDWTGTPINPQDPTRIPAGSSSGCAVAIGNGLVDVAIGSDTGGSIRMPAACCGVLGIKPTFGRVSRAGAYPQKSTLDCVGPFARNMELLIAAMTVIAPGFDNAFASTPLAKARVKLVATDSDAAITAAIEAATKRSGWQSESVTLDGMQDAFAAGMTIINAETYAAFGYLTGQGKLGADVEKRLTAAGATTPEDVEKAEAIRTRFTANVDAALKDADALIMPTLPILPPTLQDVRNGVPILSLSKLVRPFNLSGHPALSIPVPMARTRLKAGLQLIGRKGEDERICALALHLEQALHS
jgi:amidase